MVNHHNDSHLRETRSGRQGRLRTHLTGRRTHVAVVVALIAATVSSWAGAGRAAANPLCDVAGPLSRAVCGAAGNAASNVAGSVVGGSFEKIVNSLLEGYQTILTWALAWWIKLPNPQLDNSSSLMQEVHDHTLQIQIVGLTFSLMFFGLRMMIDRKRSMADDAEEGFKLIFRSAMATAAIPLALTVGGQIADGISNWLVSESVTAGGGNGDVIKNFLKLNLLTNSALGTTAIGIFALVGFLGAFLQLALLVVREAMLLLVVAALPVAAAFSGTGPGSQSYQRLVAWSVAFLLFKPVGALTYFVAFRAGASKDNAQQVVLGMVLMMLCAFVLPALMRLIAPAVASMGGGGSGAAAAGAAIGAGVAAGKVAAMAASGGATAGASGGASAGGMSSIAGRGGGGPSGGISTASAPSPPPPSGGGGPGAQPALSGGQGGQASSGGGGGGGGGGPTSGLGDAMGSAGGLAGAAMQTVADSVESEVESTSSDPSLSSPPPMRSGWNEHAMAH
ncbi:hypothetical protein [Gordonia hongkongensis]|uniref:hypothetical protein n=1 Tax=Gordonia hongkongensis TaxID=1701090 RepID=UPI003D760E50